MFDSCHSENAGPKCSEVAEKLVQLFGWRQTYKVEKLQRNIPLRGTTKISLLRPAVEKITYKGPDSWVVVHNLQSQGGGILDPDDRLSDVADDREQILASFEDGDGGHHHGGGDGASGSSSIGTGSPDIFHDGDKYGPSYSRTDIEVTGEQIASGIAGVLHVRRGSEPALNQLPAGPPTPSDHTKRWSAAPLILEPPSMSYSNPDWHEDAKEEDEDRNFHRVGRDGSNRLSMQFLGEGNGYRWAEAAERAANSRLHASTSLPREAKRREPLGQANSTSPTSTLDSDYVGELIVIRNEPGPLGIHVVPDYDRLGKDKGLLVQGIEPDGRIDRDGRLAIYDRIIEINGQSVLNMPFQRVQELFKLSLTSTELRLRVIKNRLDALRRPPPPVFPKYPDDKENVSMVECEQKRIAESTNTKVATVSPTKKVPAVSRNLKSLLTANTRRIGRKIEIELVKGPHGLGFSITTRDNPAGGNCPIYIKNIIPKKGAAVEDGRLKIGDRLLEVNGIEMTGKTQAEAVTILRNAPAGSKVRIVVSRQEDLTDGFLPRVVDVDGEKDDRDSERLHNSDVPPNIPPLPQSHLHQRTPEKGNAVARIISQFQEASNALDKSDDNLIFPWKHKEIVTFDIPVHDSEKAGLGISVKGKTSGTQDLGIFIKSVINGGAASRDKRLRTNDQLLNVNGISLLHQSNSDAMETLRKAMLHTEGPVPGSITLTVARKAGSPGPTRDASRRNSASGLLKSSSGGDLYHSMEMDPSLSQDNSGASGGSTNTVIYKPSTILDNSKPSTNDSFNNMNTWNPVLDRLTGHNKQLRNESYYMATHDTWSASMMGNQSMAKLSSPTVNLNSGEMILIEDECGPRVLPRQNSQSKLLSENYQNGNHLESRNEHEPDGKAALTSGTADKSAESTQNATCVNNDVTYASQLSLENPNGSAAFSRDAFGRQSMSEKRHATLDAKNTDTYQRSKKLREERDKVRGKETNLVRVGSVESVISVNRSSEHPEYADKLGELGPSLGMKKSSSLESLQTMVQEIQMQEEGDPAYSYRGGSGALKVIRGRGCDESFRAAVDKDYDKHLDPNHRETNAKKHWLLDPPSDFERDPEGFTNVRGGPRQSSLNAALDVKNKHAKKKPGLFKGIGSMFRFGKHRKMDFVNAEPVQSYQNTAEFDADPPSQQQLQDNGNNINHAVAQKSSDDLSEKKSEQLYQKHGFLHRHAEQVQVIPEGAIPPMRYRNNNVHLDSNSNRGERSQLMRAYEQRQAQRQAHYAAFERDNETDQRIRLQNEQNVNYGEYGRPGSRSGISDPVRFTHYVNYNELQNHLSGRKETLSDSQIVQMRLQVQQQRLKVEEESRKQHQYHSQRQVRNDNQLRPVSNFYEYESVQSILNAHGRPTNAYPQQPPPYQDPVAASSSSRPTPSRQHAANTRHLTPYQQLRGPFITHVTIGDHQPQQAGSRV
ncbi:partitioning defective 3 homolog isoform X2 [Photinus pyralis]|uniref:partitioning defective 3 homolog isoform X2 n=1 Tax=Photinus pyralis TaxID=7054 RepID=UPI001267551F|nr:partitioning defective 3 homolog isoform X2 [Photinus pyralis]